MSLKDANDGEPYYCFEHDEAYGADGFMCKTCEREICEEHDMFVEDE